jgi:hypothetical protein
MVVQGPSIYSSSSDFSTLLYIQRFISSATKFPFFKERSALVLGLLACGTCALEMARMPANPKILIESEGMQSRHGIKR